MKKNKIILIVYFVFCCVISYSQVESASHSPVGIPISFSNRIVFNERSSSSLNGLNLPQLDNNALMLQAKAIQQNCISCGQEKYYGKGIRNSINLKTSAQYYNPHINNGKLWILKINSSTALGFQFYFSTFNLPDESFLHIYSSDSLITGPYTSANNPEDNTRQIQFGTTPIMRKEVYLEYFESDSAEFTGSIIIDNIIHIFDTPFSEPTRDASGSCQNDATCRAGWGREINSIAKIVKYNINNDFEVEATGVLINNTSQDGTPYFLTAAHLVNTNTNPYDVSTWQFWFDYENKTCLPSFAGLDPRPSQVVYGASVLAQDQLDASLHSLNSDYLLLKLNTTAFNLSYLGVCYSGWSRFDPLTQFSFSPSLEFTFIHHPNGDVKKISVGNNLRQSTTIGTWAPVNMYNLNITYGGGIENGSSGCPIYNNNHKIVGTCSGYSTFGLPATYDACDALNTSNQFFGRFQRHWILGSFKQWLDPLNLTEANPYYDGPSSYCPNPNAQVIDPPVINTSQKLDEGIRINGSRSSLPTGQAIMCVTDNINSLEIKPLIGTSFSIYPYKKQVKCSSVTGSFGLSDACEQKTFLGIPTGKCICNNYSYQVYISELNYDLQPIGPLATKVYEYGYSWNISSFYVRPIEVLGHALIPGKFYNIGVANVVSGKWRYGSKILYILPTSVTVSNNTNVGSDVYAVNDITLQNSTVSSNVNFIASNRVTILPNSTLNAGKYFTDNMNCSTFGVERTSMLSTINNNPNTNAINNNYYYKQAEQYEYNSSERKKAIINDDITITPNPNNGTFQITVTKNDQAIAVKEIKVLDVMGKVIWSTGASSNNVFNVDISNYSQGIYFVRSINESGEIEMKRLIKE